MEKYREICYNENMKVESLKKALRGVKDPRRTECGNIRHKLEDILIIGLCTIVCNGEDFEDMEEFGKEREEFLRGFLELPHGIPDSDTFRRVFERVNPRALSEALYGWLETVRPEGSVIAIDGKTERGSGNKWHKAYHVVSAFVAESRLTLGELAVDEKSNEITAVPELLKFLDIEKSVVTADAMSCQAEIVKTIVKGKADYVIAAKRNQPGLYKFIKDKFHELSAKAEKFVTPERRRSQDEERTYCLLTDLSGLPKPEKWPGLKAVGRVVTTVRKGETVHIQTRYYISSITDTERFAYAVRKHWSIENQLHWCLDVIFHEDDSRAKKDNSPLNLNVLRKTALSLCRNCEEETLRKSSIQKRRYRASLNPAILPLILFGKR